MSVATVTVAKFLALILQCSVLIGMCSVAVVMYPSTVLVHKARLTAARVATDLVACRTRKAILINNQCQESCLLIDHLQFCSNVS